MLTRAQKLKKTLATNIDLSDSLLISLFSDEKKKHVNAHAPATHHVRDPDVLQTAVGHSLPITCSQLCATQKIDLALQRYFTSVLPKLEFSQWRSMSMMEY